MKDKSLQCDWEDSGSWTIRDSEWYETVPLTRVDDFTHLIEKIKKKVLVSNCSKMEINKTIHVSI